MSLSDRAVWFCIFACVFVFISIIFILCAYLLVFFSMVCFSHSIKAVNSLTINYSQKIIWSYNELHLRKEEESPLWGREGSQTDVSVTRARISCQASKPQASLRHMRLGVPYRRNLMIMHKGKWPSVSQCVQQLLRVWWWFHFLWCSSEDMWCRRRTIVEASVWWAILLID